MWNFLIACAISISFYGVQGARILGVFHMPSRGHFQIGDSIFRELAAKGHEVTVISPFELEVPVQGLKHVVLTGFMESIQDLIPALYYEADLNILEKVIDASSGGHRFTEATLSNINVQKLLKSNATFDLVIHDLYFSEAFVGFAGYYKAPSIAVGTQGALQWISSKMVNTHNPAYIASYFLSYTNDMNLLQRAANTLAYVFTELYSHLCSLPNQNKLLQKYLPDSPDLYKLHYNTSLMLLNSHVVTHNAVPFVPNMIEIGGCHIRPPKPLPKDLQVYLDDAKDGVILFSMGSVLQSKEIPVHIRNEILKSLGKLKMQVLWKWDGAVIPEMPLNIKVKKWLPQQDILAHSNVKLFITHGGLLSTIEAIYYAVPILGFPVNGDQGFNIAKAKSAGYGIGIPLKTVNETRVSAAIYELLNNPRYTRSIKQGSKILRDQPVNPLDKAIYWIEHVLRHRGAPHLQTAAIHLAWYQLLLLDVFAVVVLSTAAILYILCRGIKLLCHKKYDNHNLKKKEN